MNRLNFIFVTQAAFDTLVTDNTLKRNARYYISVGGNKFKHVVVDANGVVHEQQDNAGLDLAALGQFLTDGGYIKQTDLTAAIANFATAADVTAAIDTLNTAIQASLSGLDGRLTTAEGKITTAEGDITDLKGRMSLAEAKLVTALELSANGVTPVFVEFTGAQTAIDALDLSEDKNYAVIVTSTDNTASETVSVLGTSYVLNTASTLYLKVEGGAIVSANHDNDSVYSLLSNLQTSIFDIEDAFATFRASVDSQFNTVNSKVATLGQQEQQWTANISEFAAKPELSRTIATLMSESLLGLLNLTGAPYNFQTYYKLVVTFKGAGTTTILAADNTEYSVKDGDVLVIKTDHNGTAWVETSIEYYPAPANAALQMEMMPFDTTRFFGTNETTTPQALLTSFANQLGKPTVAMSKVITVTYRCNKLVTGVVTLVHEFANPTYDANDPNSPEFIENTYTLGDDSLIQFTATYNPTADEWTVNDTTLSVSESYNALQEGSF